jgi:cell wall-associated NlpC family hydrolase
LGILVHVRKRAITVLGVAALAAAGCRQTSGHGATAATSTGMSSTVALPQAHPQVVQPVAGASAKIDPASAPASAGVSVSSAGASASLPKPMSLADIRHQLAQSGMTASTTQATLTPDGLAVAPINAPAAVQAVIAAGNQIAHLPYRWGGGHMTYEDTAYDCSGSISYVFAAAHLLDHTVVSGALANWGQPGPGKWITVFANGGHTFMYVAGLRFDTVALAETGSRWSDRAANEPDLNTFAVRHPPGL